MKYYKVEVKWSHAEAGQYRIRTVYYKAKNIKDLLRSLHHRKGIKRGAYLPLLSLEEITLDEYKKHKGKFH